jgi:hypothetical protein
MRELNMDFSAKGPVGCEHIPGESFQIAKRASWTSTQPDVSLIRVLK